MKKKLIALTIATAICTATLSVTGCSTPKPPKALTEDEWKAAWQATYAIMNYTAQGYSAMSDSINVDKNDFESGNYEIPEINTNRPEMPLTTKIDVNLHRISGDAREGSSDENGNSSYTDFNYKSFGENNVLYAFYDLKGDWELWKTHKYESEDKTQEFFNSFKPKLMFYNMISEVGISFEDSYSSFTYNSEYDTYTGELSSTYGENNNIKI